MHAAILLIVRRAAEGLGYQKTMSECRHQMNVTARPKSRTFMVFAERLSTMVRKQIQGNRRLGSATLVALATSPQSCDFLP